MSSPRSEFNAEKVITLATKIITSKSEGKDGDKFLAYYERAQAFIKLEKFEHAIEDLTEVIKIMQAAKKTTVETESKYIHLNDLVADRGKCHFKLTQLEAALDDCNKAMKLIEKERETDSVSDFDMDIWKLIAMRTRICKAMGRYDSALIDAKIYAQKSQRSEAQLLWSLAGIDVDRREKEYSRAINDIKKLSTKSFWGYQQLDDASSFHLLGQIYSEQDEYAKALAAFDKAIELEPKKGEHYIERAIAHKRQGDYLAGLGNKTKYKDYYEKARQDLMSALIKNEKDFDGEKRPGLPRELNTFGVYHLAEIALALNDFDGATKLFNEILLPYEQSATTPKSGINSVNEALALHGLARIAYAKGEYEKCIEIVGKLVNFTFIDKTIIASFIVTGGNAFLQLGRDKEAEQYFKKASELDDNADASWGRSRIYNIQGFDTVAKGPRSNAVKLNPKKYGTPHQDLCELGNDYLAEKKYREAIVAYTEAIETNPQFSNISKGVYIKQDPMLAEAYQHRSLAHKALGNDAAAAKDRKIAATLNKVKKRLQISTLESDGTDEKLLPPLSSSSPIFSQKKPQDNSSPTPTSSPTQSLRKKK